MTTESVNFVLSAQDKASGVFNKTKEELTLLNHEVEQSTKSSGDSADAVQKLANALGGGWLVSSAAQAKELSEGVSKAAKALKEGGSGATALKVGLAGLVAVAAYKVGEAIADYALGMKAFREQIELARIEAERLNGRLLDTQSYVLAMRKKDIELFSADDNEKAEKTKELLASLDLEAKGLKDSIAAASAELEAGSWAETLTFGQAGSEIRKVQQEAIKNNQALLAQKQEQITAMQRETSEWATQQRLRQEAIKAAEELERQAQKETDAAESLTKTLELQIAQMQMSADEYELMIALQVTSNAAEQEKLATLVKQKQELAAQKAAQEELTKQQKEAIDAFVKDNAARVKAGQDARKKEADDRIKQSEKEIEQFKKDMEKTESKGQSFTSLSGSDTRMLSRSQNKIDYQAKAFELQQKQIEYQKKQQELAVKMEAHLKLVASLSKKQPKILQLIAGGGF